MLQLLYLVVLALLVGTVIAQPHQILRPSFWFCLLMAVCICPAAAFTSSDIDGDFLQADVFRFLTVIFPLAVLAWTVFTPGLSAVAHQEYWKCRNACRWPNRIGRPERITFTMVALASFSILALYLSVVPFMTTGLVTIFVNPEGATMAREKSLKLLSGFAVKYGYTWHMSVLAPLLICIAGLHIDRQFRLRNLLLIGAVPVLIVSVMLTGAKLSGGMLLLALGIVCLLRSGVLKCGLILLVAAIGTVLTATVLSIFREVETSEVSLELVIDYMTGASFQRVFVTPFQTGVWTNLYAQEHGQLGVSNIRPLALLFGQEYINLPNLVALDYAPGASAIPSSSSNTCFLFDLQASFGLFTGWAVAAVLICLLDLVLYAFAGLNGQILTAFLAVLMTAAFSLLSSAYTTCLLSHGILPAALLGAAVGFLMKNGLRRRGVYMTLLSSRPLISLHIRRQQYGTARNPDDEHPKTPSPSEAHQC